MSNSVIDRLIHWAEARAQETALQDGHGRVTHAELLPGVRARAAWLRHCGVQAGDTVALGFAAGRQSLREQVEWFYALVWLGAPVLPLYPDLPPHLHGPFANQLSARWLLDLQPLPDCRAQWLSPAGYDAAVWAGQEAPRGDVAERGFFYVFTSGTTGTPKAMCPSGAEFSAARELAVRTYGWLTEDVVLPAQTWPSKVGVRSLMRTLWMGSSFLNLPFPQTRQELQSLIATQGLSYLDCSPLQVRTLLASPPLPGNQATTLRLLSVIGAAIAPHEIAAARASLVRNLHVGYGSTEIGLMGHLGPEDAPDAPLHQIPGMQVQALDAQGNPLPDGQLGRLRFRAPWFARGYAIGAQSPHEGFHQGWFISSDIGAIVAPGRIRLAGRADDAINVGGTKVIPLDVEQALLSHPGVADAAVVGIPDAISGELVAAFLVLRTPLGVDALRAYLGTRLAPAEVPVIYVGLQMIPRNPEGKVLVQPLRELFAARKREFDAAKRG